jgi:hypothetical protein
MLYVTWASVLMWTAPEQVGLWILKLFQQFLLNPILVGNGTGALESLSRPLSVHMWNVQI